MKKELDIARKIEKLRLIMEEEDQTFMRVDVAVQTHEEGLTERILGINQGPDISRTVFNEDNSLMFLEH
jgi:hypothetical protein